MKISHFADFEQVIIKISHFADFEQVIIKISHFADFEQEQNSLGRSRIPRHQRRPLPCVTDTPPQLLRPVMVSTASELYTDTGFFECLSIQWSPSASHPLPKEAEDFPRGEKYFRHMPPPTYLIYFSPKGLYQQVLFMYYAHHAEH